MAGEQDSRSTARDTEPLAADDAARLTEFARACKAAARAVLLYPAAHPAIQATLGRVVQVTSPVALRTPLRITVLPDGLLLDGHAPARVDQAVAELASLLHGQLVGELTVHPGGDVDAWRGFLLLLSRPQESLRTEGGIARVWSTMAGRHVELREIDYAQVLKERSADSEAAWEQIIACCLSGMSFELEEQAIEELLAISGNPERLADIMREIEGRARGAGMSVRTAALLRMLREIVSTISTREADRLDPVLRNLAQAVGGLSPETLLSLLAAQSDVDDPLQLVTTVVSRMDERTIAKFVARNVIADGGSTERLAQAFQTLVRGEEDRERLLALAREDVAASPLGSTEGFETVWNDVAQKMLTSYSDEPFVSEEYGRELSAARARAVEIEQVSDDPQERVSGWLNTVSAPALRTLDVTLLLDLLRLEEDDAKWSNLKEPVVALVEDLLLVGDFDAASQLVDVLVREAAGTGSQARRQAALTAIDLLAAGSMMGHIGSHLPTVDEAQFNRIKTMCVSLGEVLVRPLAEALSTEERGRTRERLSAILLAFGAVGRRTVERLKGSPNAAVRRTAIYLMREFGGTEALPDLTELLDDSEPRVQREAVRAILNIGTDRAYQVLEQALATGTSESREAIMQAIALVRDERVTPLFTYILQHVDYRRLTSIYLHAIESLGSLRDPDAVEPLKAALYKGEWWAPRRAAAVRGAAAAALARIGTPEARLVLEEASGQGPRGVRTAARTHLSALPMASAVAR